MRNQNLDLVQPRETPGQPRRLAFLWTWAAAAAVLVCPTSGEAKEYQANILSPGTSGFITGLIWSSRQARVEVPRGGKATATAYLEGRLGESVHAAPNRMILVNDKPFAVAKRSGAFVAKVTLTGSATKVVLKVMDNPARPESQEIIIDFPEYKTALLTRNKLPQDNPIRWSVGAGFTVLNYTQDRIEDFSENAVTVRGGMQYRLLGSLDLNGSFFYTMVPLSQSRDDATARSLGINLRAGSGLSLGAWRLSAQLGLYYTTMAVTSDLFGLSNLIGSQIFLSVRRTVINAVNAVQVYFKYSPLIRSEAFLSSRNREISTGATWQNALGEGRSVSFNFDFSNLTLFTPVTGARLTTVTLGISYGW